MAGSKEGNNSKSKGNSKSKKSDAINHVQISNNSHDGPKVSNLLSNRQFQKRINLTPALVERLKTDVPILTAAVQRNIGFIKQQAIPSASGKVTEVSDILGSDEITGCSSCLRGCLENNANDSKTALIVDLVKDIRGLQKEVKEQKEWAQKKVIDSAKRLSADLLELNMLRMEKLEKDKGGHVKTFAEKSCILKLMETEQSLRKVKCEVNLITETVRRREIQNAQITADTEALKLHASESEKDLREVLKRERRFMKKLADKGKQTDIFRAQLEEEKQRELQFESELLQAEQEAQEAEMKWKLEIKEKEHMFALLAEEIRMAEIRKANSRAQLSKLRQKVEIDSQLARDERMRLEDELSHLLITSQMSDVSLEDDNVLFNGIEAKSSELNARCESSENATGHWDCMICMENEVSVVLLPCTHQVVCVHCYEGRRVGGRCPYCQVEIEETIKVYGPSW